MTPLLEDKNAIVYGGSGSVGGAVARAFASEGARVFLAGRLFNRVPSEARYPVSHGSGPQALHWHGSME